MFDSLFDNLETQLQKEAATKLPLKAVMGAVTECDSKFGAYIKVDADLRVGFLSDDIRKVTDRYAHEYGADPDFVFDKVASYLKESALPVEVTNPKSIDVTKPIGGANEDTKYRNIDVEETHKEIGVDSQEFPYGGRDPDPKNPSWPSNHDGAGSSDLENDLNSQGGAEKPPYTENTTTFADSNATSIEMPKADWSGLAEKGGPAVQSSVRNAINADWGLSDDDYAAGFRDPDHGSRKYVNDVAKEYGLDPEYLWQEFLETGQDPVEIAQDLQSSSLDEDSIYDGPSDYELNGPDKTWADPERLGKVANAKKFVELLLKRGYTEEMIKEALADIEKESMGGAALNPALDFKQQAPVPGGPGIPGAVPAEEDPMLSGMPMELGQPAMMPAVGMPTPLTEDEEDPMQDPMMAGLPNTNIGM